MVFVPLNIVFYFSVLGQSHFSFLTSAVTSLINRGHVVDIIYANFNDQVRLKPIPGVRNEYFFGFEKKDYWLSKTSHLGDPFIVNNQPFVDHDFYDELAVELCSIAILDDNLLSFLKNGNYNIGITNDYDPCGAILFEATKIPSTASLLPTPILQTQALSAGLPTVSSLYGTTAAPKHDGSMYDKIFHFLRSAYNIYHYLPKWYSTFDVMTRNRFGADFPSSIEIEKNVDVVFVNSNQIIEKPRPISHKIKYIGGIGMSKAKPIPRELESIMNRATTKGIVLFSFGTQVPTRKIPVQIRRNFVEAFKKFPDFLFLWKYDDVDDDQDIFENVENVERVKWLPQTDLLQDKRVKCFITHMGLNSFTESSLSGVPMLAIPLFVDQYHNAQNAFNKQIGIIVDKDKLTVNNIENALSELLLEPNYSENAKKISKMMRSKPEKSEKVFIEWVEYIGNNPGFHNVVNLPQSDPFTYYCVFCHMTAYESIQNLKECLDIVKDPDNRKVCAGKMGPERDQCVHKYTEVKNNCTCTLIDNECHRSFALNNWTKISKCIAEHQRNITTAN